MKWTFSLFGHVLFTLAVIVTISLSACTSGNFSSGGKSKQGPKNSDQPKGATDAKNGNGGDGKHPQDLEEPSAPAAPAPQQPESQVVPPANDKLGYAVRFPVIGIINMDSKYQISNEGFRVSVEQNGKVLAQAPLNLLSFMDGASVDMQGSAYGKPFLTKSKAMYVNPSIAETGAQKAKISICMPKDLNAAWDKPIDCKDLNGFVGHSNGSNTFVGLDADVEVTNNNIAVHNIYNARSKGDCGTSKVPCASIMHPIFGYATQSGDGNNDNASPLVLDLNQNGKIDLISAFSRRPVSFDIAGLGAKIKTGWVAAGDGLLAMDVNGNGTIDSGAELFGEHSQAKGNALSKFANGFVALAQFDGNRDHKIDQRDAVFNKLLVWRDQNQDGISQKWELSGMFANDIASLNLEFKKTAPGKLPEIVNGNELRLAGSYVTKSGKVLPMNDVWFELRLNQSVAELISH